MELVGEKYVVEGKYQKKINNQTNQCLTCEHRCKIKRGSFGKCNTRYNHNGKIISIVYGCIPAESNNPIEKKPLYHFFPGTKAFTIGTYGCNFNCFWCQNHRISHPKQRVIELVQKSKDYYSPEDIIDLTINNKCQGTSISFNEPTLLFEYSLEVFKLATKKNLYNTYVTNGYMTSKVLKDLVEAGLNAMNIDIKGDSKMIKRYCGADIERVWENVKLAQDLGVHIELTLLLIENLNSDEKIINTIANRIVNEFGKDTPFHISRFFPSYKSIVHNQNKPTQLKSLYKAYNIAKETGLNYVYLGNINNKKYYRTVCPNCSQIVIKRNNTFGVEDLKIDKNGQCINCGHTICIT